MTRHQELVALRIRADRCTAEARRLRERCAYLEQRLAEANARPSRHQAELVDLSIALVQWERLPWYRRMWTTPSRMMAALEAAA